MRAATDISQIDGLCWPSDDAEARPVILRDCASSVAALLQYVSGRDCIVQAGGNVGVYPIALASHFAKVVTAEPDPVNFACLVRNVSAAPERHNIRLLECAFGAEMGACMPVEVQPRNCGANRVAFSETGPVRVLPIDALALPACDCIWLDIEGSELFALQGAEKTIERFSPVIAVEDKGLHRAFEIPDGALQAWLAAHGYVEIDRIGNDKVFRRPE